MIFVILTAQRDGRTPQVKRRQPPLSKVCAMQAQCADYLFVHFKHHETALPPRTWNHGHA